MRRSTAGPRQQGFSAFLIGSLIEMHNLQSVWFVLSDSFRVVPGFVTKWKCLPVLPHLLLARTLPPQLHHVK